MADLQKDDRRDERAEKTPTSESTQRTPQDSLNKDDSRKEDKDKGAANTGMGRQDSNVGKSSGSTGSSQGNLGSQTPNRGSSGTSQAPGKDSGANKGINQPGMKR